MLPLTLGVIANGNGGLAETLEEARRFAFSVLVTPPSAAVQLARGHVNNVAVIPVERDDWIIPVVQALSKRDWILMLYEGERLAEPFCRGLLGWLYEADLRNASVLDVETPAGRSARLFHRTRHGAVQGDGSVYVHGLQLPAVPLVDDGYEATVADERAALRARLAEVTR